MKNFEIKYEYNGYNNELKGIIIDYIFGEDNGNK